MEIEQNVVTIEPSTVNHGLIIFGHYLSIYNAVKYLHKVVNSVIP